MASETGGTRSARPLIEVPAIQLASSVVFPSDVVSVQISESDPGIDILRGADEELVVALVFDKKGNAPVKRRDALRSICILCRVAQCVELPGGGLQAVFQGLARASVHTLRHIDGYPHVRVEQLPHDVPDTSETNRRVLQILDLVGEYVPRDGSYPEDLESIFRMNVRGPGRFADLVAAYLHLPLAVKRDIAATERADKRLEFLALALECELQRCSVEEEIQGRVRHQLEDRQKEQYLRHQMRAIRRELGDEGSPDEEHEELMKKLEEVAPTAEAAEICEREIRRLQTVPTSSAEYHVIRTYVGWILDIPWKKRSKDRLDIKKARRVLDEDHTGLTKLKERILEHLAVRKLKKDMRSPILCLVGPPGVGKTSLGRSVARAMGRKFVRMSVGGLRDEAEIKGHRRTYVGAMPGKVIQLLKVAGTKNPVLQIDELDKMGSDARGDPASAILEVLDAEVNAEFRDYYMDLGVDLSQVFFIATANLVETIPSALRDRLEIHRIGGYTRNEKLLIARNHLVPRAIEACGLQPSHVRFNAAGVGSLIDGHTREAGLRELERGLKSICRKVAIKVVEGDTAPVTIGKRRVREFLGPEPYKVETAQKRPEIGVATGMAWTAAGGALLLIEANQMPGRGQLLITGSLGEVMRESANAALSYIRAHCEEFDIAPEVFRRNDLHIHFPEGATPKDGPSAGAAIATCLASLLTNRPVRHDLAMTGEVTLKGRVLEVGGIKEKLLAAHRCGIRRVLLPKDNLKDLEDVPREVRDQLEIVGTDDVMTNICEAVVGCGPAGADKLPRVDSELGSDVLQVGPSRAK
jgi:ATP-dependent Lon protease